MKHILPNNVLLTMMGANCFIPTVQLESTVLRGIQLQVCSDFIDSMTRRHGSLCIPALRHFMQSYIGTFQYVGVDDYNSKIRLFDASPSGEILVGKELHILDTQSEIYTMNTQLGVRTFNLEKIIEHF